MDEISRTTWWLLTAVVMTVVVFSVAVFSGQLGFWEPFESTTVQAGAEFGGFDANDGEGIDDEVFEELDDEQRAAVESKAVVTVQGQPVNLSWLRTWWTSRYVDAEPVVEKGGIGEVERRVRILLLVLGVMFLGAAALWARRHLGEGPAAMTVAVLATTPIFYLGAVFLSGPMVFVAGSTLSILAFFQAVYGDARWQPVWTVAGGLALALVALDKGLVGVVATVAVLVAWACSQAVDGTNDGDETDHKSLCPWSALVAVAVFVGFVGWGLIESRDFDEGMFRPDVAQTLWMAGPASLLIGLAVAARRSEVGRALFGIRGLVYALVGLLPVFVLGQAYSSVLSGDPEMAEEGSRTLAFLLERDHLSEEVAAQGDFSWWWRPVGFGLLPHVMFLIPALGYLGWKLRPEAETTGAKRAAAILCLAWPVATFVVMAPAAELGHTVFPAVFPLVLAIGWMLSDAAFWRTLRLRPAIYLAICVVAAFTLYILIHDLDDFPTRLVEFVIGGAEDTRVDETFQYGDRLRWWTRLSLLGVFAYFAGLISFVATSKLLWWRSDEDDKGDDGDDGDDTDKLGAGQRRMKQREQWRDGLGLWAVMAARLERQPGLVALVVISGLGLMIVQFDSLIDDLDDEFSSRAVIEAYLNHAADEALWRYDVEEDDTGFYVRGIDEVPNRRRFYEKYDDEKRFFALIPEDQLARINSRARRDRDENLPILAASGGMYLVTNALDDDERDVNPIADYVLDEPDDEYTAVTAQLDGETRHPEFDGQIEYLGYRLDREPEDGRAVYQWGDTIELTQYFRVNQRVPSSQEMFIHIDMAGERLHGDHDPVKGLYPTNHWRPGDVIKDVHEIDVELFDAVGVYTVWMGFYRGDDRMSVTPEELHDGQDRLEVTTIEVAPSVPLLPF